MGRFLRPTWITALITASVLATVAYARNWGSVDFELTPEGMAAAEKVHTLCGEVHTYQRLRDGELLSDAETFAVYEDIYADEPAFRVETRRHDDDSEELVTHVAFLDALTLRPLASSRPLRGMMLETVYGRDEAVVSSGATVLRTLDTDSDTLDFTSLQLVFLKFADDPDRIPFSFLFGDVKYRFHASFKESETVVLGSRSYDTMHIVCKMRGTWAHLAPALHFWIESTPPHRLVRYQARREVVELVE